jgi:hypothetical protein
VGGTVQFGACGGATCVVATDARGIASTTVTPLTAGTIALSAAGPEGTQVSSFHAVTRVRTVAAAQGMEYVAAGATFVWTPQLVVTDNSASAVGVGVNWQTVSGPIVFSVSQSQTNGQGVAQSLATIGPLADGGEATATGCAWTTVCAGFTAQGVAASDLRLVIAGGAGQVVDADGSLGPVRLLVTDTASHPVAGAVVTIYQTVNGWEMACPVAGRCPVAPVYASSMLSASSDANGVVTVVPQQLSGVAEVTNIAASAGTQGFVSLALEKQP